MIFSVVVPIYNVEKYLRECIDSILSQDFRDFELILVDDGSIDSSPLICEEYKKKDPRIKVIHQKNAGQAAARNSGTALAEGDYICYIDSDDFLIDTNVFGRLSEKIINQPDIVHYKFVEWLEEWNSIKECYFNYNISIENRTLTDIYCDLINNDAYYNSAWSKIVKRKFLIDNNIQFCEGIYGEDNDWYYHVVMSAKTLELLDEPLYVYRRRKGSTTKTIRRKNLEDQIFVLNKWEEILNNSNQSAGKVVWWSLAKQYCSALIMYAQLDNVSDLFIAIREKSFLLRYSNNKRVRIFRILRKIIGLRGIILMLKIIKSIK